MAACGRKDDVMGKLTGGVFGQGRSVVSEQRVLPVYGAVESSGIGVVPGSLRRIVKSRSL